MHYDWKKYNQSQLGKEKKCPSSIYLAAKQLPSHVFALKTDKFVSKVKVPKKKPCSITPQERAKQYPRKFHADDNLLFCSTCDVAVDRVLLKAGQQLTARDGPAARRPEGPAAHARDGPAAQWPSPDFPQFLLSSGKFKRIHRSASGLGVQNGRQ